MGNKHNKRKRLTRRELLKTRKQAMEDCRKSRHLNPKTTDTSESNCNLYEVSDVTNDKNYENLASCTTTSPLLEGNDYVLTELTNVRSNETVMCYNTTTCTESNGNSVMASNRNDNISPNHTRTLELEDSNDNYYVIERCAGSKTKDKSPEIEERRICDVRYLLENMKILSQHSTAFGCGIQNLELIGEKRKGLLSLLKFKCNMCNKELSTHTSDPKPVTSVELNKSIIMSAVTTGVGFTQLEEIFYAINIPFLSEKFYRKINDSVSEDWHKVATEQILAAAEKERLCAINEGRVTEEGIPVIDVIVDGCWSKRSYRTNYSALSGAAAIIGRRFGEVIYIGVKNKYCCVCARAENKNLVAKEHKCFKNFAGSSTSMESEILVEGFKQSLDMHGLIYGRMIGDGDSATYNKIIEARPYPNYTVEKIECRNHLLRNLCNKLQALMKETKYPLEQRKLITTGRILAIRKVICLAIKYLKNSKEVHSTKINNLYLAIINSYYHAFGDHTKCEAFYCESKRCNEDLTKKLKDTSTENRIQYVLGYIGAHARSLIEDVDSNSCERLNSIIAKYTGGKRINFSLKNSYTTRSEAAVVAFNTRRPLYKMHKQILGRSPRSILARKELQKIKKNSSNKTFRPRKLEFQKGKEAQDENYGQNCQKPDIPEEDFERLKKTFMKKLAKTNEEISHIERITVHQSDSAQWMEIRRKLITASNFGKIMNRRKTTSAKCLVEQLLYSRDISTVASIKHGRENEKVAVKQLEAQENVKIKRCGLFICKDHPFLGASPDGVIDQNRIVEVKCPISAFDMSLEDAILKKKIPFYKTMRDGKLAINKKHSWFFQIQGQLNISKRRYCLLGIWFGEKKPLQVEIIERDQKLWTEVMVPKLRDFYSGAILPEILDPRKCRNMPLRSFCEVNTNSISKRKLCDADITKEERNKRLKHDCQISLEESIDFDNF